MSAREKNILAFVQHTSPDIDGVDVSQNILRSPKATSLHGNTYLPTLTTSSKVYLFKPCRLLCGAEALACQGFPVQDHREVLTKTHPRLMHDLAGNAMSMSVIFAVYVSMMLSLPWVVEAVDPKPFDLDLDSAIGAFSSSIAGRASDEESE